MWLLNEHAAGPEHSADAHDDESGASPVELGVVTSRELQAGVSYSFTPNVRIMGNVARLSPSADRNPLV